MMGDPFIGESPGHKKTVQQHGFFIANSGSGQ
jgi:hypothetical protein